MVPDRWCLSCRYERGVTVSSRSACIDLSGKDNYVLCGERNVLVIGQRGVGLNDNMVV